MQRMVAEETKRLQIIMEEGIEKELKKQKEAQIKANIAGIRQDEKDQLNEKSQPIRYYLKKNLNEILTEGLIQTCKLQPKDPVDSLASFLFSRANDVPYPNPVTFEAEAAQA